MFYIVKVKYDSDKIAKIEIFFFGEKTFIKVHYFKLEENESILFFNLKKDFIVTSIKHFNLYQHPMPDLNSLTLTYKIYSFSTKKLIARIEPVHLSYNICLFENPYDGKETLVYFC